jgi:hypothetical protein
MAAKTLEDHVAEIEQRNAFRNKQNAIDYWLSQYERHFAETGNPICVWATIRYCDEKGIDLPEWVLTYLHESASRVLEIAEGPAKTAGGRCLHALGFSRAGKKESPFEDWSRWKRREPACLDFARRICSGNAQKNARSDTAGAFNVAPTTLDTWLCDFFPEKGQRKETWSDFFRQELDLEGPRFNKALAALLGGAHFRRVLRADPKSPGPV